MMTLFSVWLLSGLSTPALPGPTSAVEGEAPPKRPAYAFLRADEDWSGFEGGDDPFDPYKRINLGGDTWVSLGGRIESRFESWNDFTFGAAMGNDDFIVSRALAHADFHFGTAWRLFVELKTAQATQRDLPGGRRTLDMDTFEVQQLFAEIPFAEGAESRWRARVGRQMFSFGKQRLLSPLPWGNTLRSWEGVTVDRYSGPWRTTAFFTAFVPVDKTDFNERDDDQLLYGVYARRAESGSKSGLELYAIGTTRDGVTFNGTTGNSERQTLGARYWRPLCDNVDLEAEAALQGGEVGTQDVSAGFATAELGWKPGGPEDDGRWFLGLDWASGDDAAGGKVGTFDQLFPLGHAYLGFMDFIGRQNVVAANVGYSCKPAEDLQLRASVHGFWLEDTADAIYNSGGGVLRAPGSFSSREVAQEFDLLARYKFDRHLSGYAGYSHLFAGDALADSGPSEDADFFYLGLAFTF